MQNDSPITINKYQSEFLRASVMYEQTVRKNLGPVYTATIEKRKNDAFDAMMKNWRQQEELRNAK
jgi:hypothetical protein